ncbi:helix-turn-helix domain-containing protein [Streptomyces sp. C36]|uniref:helix-turn-helix domain-containing protein n=1 Tax=Streptomyces sp. C36 TaxID=3237122 RepID=UPI0034C67924
MGLPSPIGEQLARLRARRGLTQEDLASRAGVGVDVVRRLEQGVRSTARLATLARLAKALDVGLPTLMAQPDVLSASSPSPAGKGMLDLRRVLTPSDALTGFAAHGDVDVGAPTLEALSASIGEAWGLYQEGSYSAVVASLPDLIAELRHAVRDSADTDKVVLNESMATACEIAAGVAIALGKEDLAFIAVERAVAAAEASGSELQQACAANFATWILCRQGRYDEAEAFAVCAAQHFEPSLSRADAPHVAVFGALLINASAAASRNDRAASCRDLLGVARAAAARYQVDHADRQAVFGPSVVAMSAVSDAVEYGDLDEALRLVDEVPEDGRVPTTWRARYLLNVAYVQQQARKDADAVATLMQARALAPEWMTYHPLGRDVVAELLDRRGRRRMPELGVLADHLGVRA